MLNLWHAQRWLRPSSGEFPGFASLLRGSVGDLLPILTAGRVDPAATTARAKKVAAVNDLLARVQELVDCERFLHWELAFPTVWQPNRKGGFDAVIGNPPWDRWRLLLVAERTFRRLDHPELLPEVALGTRYRDGIRILDEATEPRNQEAAA